MKHRPQQHPGQAQITQFDGHQWRALDECNPSLLQSLQALQQPALADGMDRREFMRLMASSMALAGITACSPRSAEKILPYTRMQSELIQSNPLYFASAWQLGGEVTGILVQSQQGRPTKVEGNPAHPASLGATDIYAQASVLDLWDPDRSQSVLHDKRISTWQNFLNEFDNWLRQQTGQPRIHVLSGMTQSPTQIDQMRMLRQLIPTLQWHIYEPINHDHAYAATRMAYGRALDTRYHLDRCRVVLSLDADFLAPPGVRSAHDFISARRNAEGEPDPGRLYQVETAPSITGAIADHRLLLKPSAIENLARALARTLGLEVDAPTLQQMPADWIKACARDLRRAGAQALVIVGEAQPAWVHALAHAMNQLLGSAGSCVEYIAPLDTPSTRQMESLKALVAAMDAGQVDALFILGTNPVYDCPADIDFAASLKRVAQSIHLGLYNDETAASCRWHIPQAHYLESWSDVRAADGTVSLCQPLIEPLYGAHSALELLASTLTRSSVSDYSQLRNYWQRQRPGPGFEQFWNRALQLGVVEGTAAASVPVLLDRHFLAQPMRRARATESPLELRILPDPALWDGRFANNAWLQELPRPLSKLTWDNAALISPSTAQALGLSSGDQIELKLDGAQLNAPVWVMPGHADDSVSITLGYGRWHSGRVGQGVGFNAYALRFEASPWMASGLEVRAIGKHYDLAVTQHHHRMEGRDPVQVTTFNQYQQAGAHAINAHTTPEHSLYNRRAPGRYAWGMSINLDACIGCNACTIACQAENNIPVVGRKEVLRGREMHWMRIDRYYQGNEVDPVTLFQPVACMHCEHAPCEVVCPVEATVHDSDGLNVQVYNRCIGTRFCSNNCPYKVRRFNFLQYADEETESLKGQRNPEVTVRMRGVMEKCTFCIQRITRARIEAEKDNRSLRDGEVVTACQAVCPTGAIVFGDLNLADSAVSQAKNSALKYDLLAEINTRPRTSYLARLLNPNPDLQES